MEPKEKLTRLREQALALEATIEGMDYEIERAMHAVAAGTQDTGRAMTLLTERRNAQLGLMFDLGKLTARIEDLENRARELTERQAESLAAQAWEEGMPLAQVDQLDWLRPVLDEPAVNTERDSEAPNPQREGEDRMLSDMHREQEPEDYLDWWKR